jgi:pimeloyl-ACP methyl ester carboxylesterase
MSLLDRPRPALAPPTRSVARALVHLGAAAAWRITNPSSRDPFLPARPRPLTRLYYTAPDGWHAPMLVVPPAPGGAGEPVLLLHALGSAPDVFRIGDTPTLASRLAERGFTVFLVAHRGDRGAVAPDGAAGFSFDDLVEKDLPAAAARAAAHAGFARVHLVGYGLGGQLALAAAARRSVAIGAVASLCAPVRFQRPATGFRRMSLVAAMLPPTWEVPAGSLAPLLAPWIGDPTGTNGRTIRGALQWGAGPLPAPLVQQVMRWLADGSLVDRYGTLDYREALVDARGDLLVVIAPEDTIAPPDAVRAAADHWGGRATELVLPPGYGHADALFAANADVDVFQPVSAWLAERRRLAW